VLVAAGASPRPTDGAVLWVLDTKKNRADKEMQQFFLFAEHRTLRLVQNTNIKLQACVSRINTSDF